MIHPAAKIIHPHGLRLLLQMDPREERSIGLMPFENGHPREMPREVVSGVVIGHGDGDFTPDGTFVSPRIHLYARVFVSAGDLYRVHGALPHADGEYCIVHEKDVIGVYTPRGNVEEAARSDHTHLAHDKP